MSLVTLDGNLPVITGFGVVSALGVGAAAFWQSVQDGQNAVRPVKIFDTSKLRNHVGCEIDDATLAAVTPARWSGLPRASRLGAIAAAEALSSAGLAAEDMEGLAVGTTMADLPDIEMQLGALDQTANRSAASAVLGTDFGTRIAESLGVRGRTMTIATSCSAGNIAIFRVAGLIRQGICSRLLAGGADAFSRVAFIGFSRMRAMAPDRCTPFSCNRKGMLLGEGAAFLVVESLRAARARGARIYAAIAGYGLSCDAYHIATPDPSGRGAATAARLALRNAGVEPWEVDYVSAHGTGTHANDLAESRACQLAFGDHRPFISSLKALIGHTLGAASALEAVASVLSLRDQLLIPAWNVETPDPACDVELPLPGRIDRSRRLTTVVSNAFAFGGNNSCLVLQSCQ